MEVAPWSEMIPYVCDLVYSGFFSWIGVAVVAIWLLWFILTVFRGFKNFVWSRIGPRKDFVGAYGKWAVVTGGSDGIGKGWAMEFAKRGLNICVISKDEFNITEEIRLRYPVEVKYINVDFSDPEVYDSLEKELSQLDEIGVLVNNVGMFLRDLQLFANTSRETMDKMVNVNVKSVVMMTHLVLKGMIARNKGLIINMGSMSSVLPFPYASLYSSTKSFVELFSLCLEAELMGTNVQVHCVRPFFVNTNLIKTSKNLIGFLSIAPIFFPRADAFASSAAAIFNNESAPLYTTGFWAHALLEFLAPLRFFEKSWFAKLTVLFSKTLLKAENLSIPAEAPPQESYKPVYI